MTSRLKSIILRRKNSFKHATLSTITDTIRPRRSNVTIDDLFKLDESIHNDFVLDDNYQSILKCLDGGYEVSMDLISYLEDYCHGLKDDINRFNSYSKKWKSKITDQAEISSYHTTKRAQIQTVTATQRQAQLIQSRYDAIQQVITSYRREVEKMYPSERLGIVHKHYKTEAMRKSFQAARLPLEKLHDELDESRSKKKKAEKARHNAAVLYENYSLDSTTDENTLKLAKDTLDKKQRNLDRIDEEIACLQERCDEEEKNYRKEAIVLYEKCRELEQERLDQIGQTLAEFVKAAYSSEYSRQEQTIYEDLMSMIKIERNTLKDLDFWADTHHVYSSTTLPSDTSDDENIIPEETVSKKKNSQQNQTATLPTKAESTQQLTMEAEEEQSLADTTAVSTKSKAKKTNRTLLEIKNNTKLEAVNEITSK